MNERSLKVDPLFIGLTRPATKFGIPLLFFMISMCICLLSFLILVGLFQSLLLAISIAGGTFALVNGYAYIATMQDPFGMSVRWINIVHFRRQPTFRFWANTHSYFPG